MSNINTQIFDKIIHRTVKLEKFTESEKTRVFNLLKNTQSEIISEIVKNAPTDVYRTRYQRQRMINLNRQVGKVLNENYGKIKKESISNLKKLSIIESNKTGTDINNILGADIFDIRLSEENLRSIVDNTLIEGKVIKNWWDKQKDNFSDKFQSQMVDATKAVQIGTVKGEGLNELIKRVVGTATSPGIMKIARKEATSLLRTSINQVANESRQLLYQANEDLISGYQIIATLDLRTTDLCRALDGLKYKYNSVTGLYTPISHDMNWRGYPPFHWSCRTTIISLLKSFFELIKSPNISKKQLKALDSLPNSTRTQWMGTIEGDMTYNKWLKGQSKENQIIVLGKKRQKIWKEKGLSMKDLIHQDGSPLTLKEL